MGKTRWWISAVTLIGISLLGWAASQLITKRAAADPQRKRPTHPFAQTVQNLHALRSHKRLFAASAANGFLWFLAALSQVNVYLVGTTSLHVAQEDVGLLLAALAAGVGIGSVTAGIWSGRTIELGLVPVGALGIAVTAIMMFVVSADTHKGAYGGFYWSVLYLSFMGFSAGLYAVPLQAYLQYKSPQKNRGQILSANNFISFTAMLTASLLFWVMRSLLGSSAGVIFLAAGLITLLAFIALIIALPHQTARAILKPLRLLLLNARKP